MWHFSRLFLLTLLSVLGSSTAQALDYYWKGGDGDFNNPQNWWVGSFGSGVTASNLPLSTDNVFFTAAAFSGSTAANRDTVYVNSSASCANFWWDPSIPTTNRPVLFSLSNNTIFLDFYGHFELSPEMIFSYRGRMRFRSSLTSPTRLRSAGHVMTLWDVEINGVCGSSFVLQDQWQIIGANNTSGTINLIQGILNTNGQRLIIPNLQATSSSACRGLILDNSYIQLNSPQNTLWNINFNGTAPNYSVFSATGSRIDLRLNNYGQNWTREFIGGRNLVYDTLSSNFMVRFRGVGGATSVFNQFSDLYIEHGADLFDGIEVISKRTFISGAKRHTYTFGRRTNILRTDTFIRQSNCQEFIVFNTTIENDATSVGIISKNNPGHLFLDRCILIDMGCNTTGGRTYSASNSISRGNTSPDFNITAPSAGQAFFFRDRGNRRWSNPNNWDIWNGSSFVPNSSGCLPSAIDDVYFDNLSFPNAVKRVIMDTSAYCRHLRWLPSVANNSGMDAGNSVMNILYMYGSMQLASNQHPVDAMNGVLVALYGTGDSIIVPNQLRTWSEFYFQKYGYYYIAGDLDVNTIDWNTNRIYCNRRSTIEANFVQIRLNLFTQANRVFDSVQVYMAYNNSSTDDLGGTVIQYTGNTTYWYNGVNASSNTSVGPGVYPNMVGNCLVNFSNGTFIVQGDLTLNHNASFYGIDHPSNFFRLNLTGSMALYDGNLSLAAGRSYVIASHPNSFLNISGKVQAQGDCQNNIRLITAIGRAIPFNVTDVSNSNFQHLYLEGINATGSGGTLTAFNSIDGGNNLNWNFNVAGPGQTFYWRAHRNNGADFAGRWSDPGHWTTNPLSLRGDSACIPTLLDSVIFDSLSFFGPITSGICSIDGAAQCRTLWMKANIFVRSTSTGAGTLTINESLVLDRQMTNLTYSGTVTLNGSGNIQSRGTVLPFATLTFNRIGGTWELQDSLHLRNASATTYGGIIFLAGTLNTNDHSIYTHTYWTFGYTTSAKTINLGNSVLNIMGRAEWNGYNWYCATANTTINPGNSVLNLHGNQGPESYMAPLTGTAVRYNRVNVHSGTQLYGAADYNYLCLYQGSTIRTSCTTDSIFFAGGQFYYLVNNVTVTLRSPHGKIISDGSAGSYVNLETSPTGGRSFFYKDHGTAFCLDFIKVRDNEARKQSNLSLVPPTWQAIHSILKFETGVNSDNINGTATGIWDFSLPIFRQPRLFGDSTLYTCGLMDSAQVPVQLIGNAPYIFRYQWTDNLGNIGLGIDTIPDSDNDALTPTTHWIQASNQLGATLTQYQVQLSTYRCGEPTAATPINIRVFNTAAPNVLVPIPSLDTCVLNNLPRWHTFTDPLLGRPILSVMDKTSTSDLTALGEVQIAVNFDPTAIQYYNGVPYLPRHWRITPQQNGPGRVRLYFTETEMARLQQVTYMRRYPRMSPLSDLQVRKFESGILGVGPSVIIPHDTLVWTAANRYPFTNINGLIGVELLSPSFSYFILEPTDIALLPLQLLSFEAAVTAQQQVQVQWTVAQEQDLLEYRILRSADGQWFEPIGTVAAQQLNQYSFLDRSPLLGTSYYRLQAVEQTGELQQSAIRSITLSGTGLVDLYPNPTRDQVNIRLNASQGEQVKIQIYDALGRMVLNQSFDLQTGLQTLSLPLSGLAPGSYQVLLQSPSGAVQRKALQIF